MVSPLQTPGGLSDSLAFPLKWDSVKTMLILIKKELQLEWGGKDGLPLAVGFSLVCLLSLNFVLDYGQASEAGYASAGIWIAILFASTLLLNRSMIREREAGALTALALSPVDPGSVYLAKAFGLMLNIMILEATTVAFAGLFLGAHVERLGFAGAGALGLGGIGLAALGVIQGAMAVHTRAREALLPILLFPLAVPILLIGGQIVHYRLGGIPENSDQGLLFLLCFDVLFLAAGYILFQFLMEDG